MKSDSQIQKDVTLELLWDPSVTHEQIGVSVKDAIVTMSGTAPSYAEKFAAEKAAQRVSGVKAVVEKIDVSLPFAHKRGDQELAQAIVDQFKWNVRVPESLIKTSVENGSVVLSGEVEWDFQRSAAENAVQSLTGVRGLFNNITLKPKKVETAIVKQKIEEALKREAKKEADRISVEVIGNKVILTGDVHSFSEMENAKWAAWSALGVKTVENRLSVNTRL